MVEDRRIDERTVISAIEEGREYLLTHPDRIDGRQWSSPLSIGIDGVVDLRQTLYYGLLLEHLGVDAANRNAALEYALSQRVAGAGWGDAPANHCAWLLLSSVSPDEYADVIEDVETEMSAEDQSLLDDPDSYEEWNALFQTRLFYGLMSDKYTANALFASDPPIEEFLFETPAFTEPASFLTALPDSVMSVLERIDDGIDADSHAIRPDLMDSIFATGIIRSVIRDETVFDSTVSYLLAGRLRNGVWKTAVDTIYAVLALSAVGYSPNDETISRPLRTLGNHYQQPSGRIANYHLPVWDTGFAIQALRAAGVPESVFDDALEWLEHARTAEPKWTRLDSVLERSPTVFRRIDGRSGWGFKPYMYSDWEDTGVALLALADVDRGTIQDALDLLFETQNDDGSWSAFVVDFSPLDRRTRHRAHHKLGDKMASDLFGDHSMPAPTGHVLEALGAHGYSVTDRPEIQRAIEYFADSATAQGLWMGVWGVGYLYGTGCALRGIAAVDADTRSFVEEACDTLLAAQNDDGGWGERSTYELGTHDVPFERGPSTPEQTAWTVHGLLESGVAPSHEAIEDGISYLFDAQHTDGSWDVHRVLYNIGSYRYETATFSHASVLESIVKYATERGISVPAYEH